MTPAQTEVLIVEDDPDLNEMLGAYMELSGFRHRSALDGTSALEQLRDHLPELVLLDLMLPDLDGLEICQRMRAEKSTRGVPVVILTARDEPGSRERARACAVAAYLTKPFDPDVLMATIRRVVDEQEALGPR